MSEATQIRLEKLREKKAKREYGEAREAAGFSYSDDYDEWLVLEELRKLTLAERAAAAASEKPKPPQGGAVNSITINGPGIGGPVHPGPVVAGRLINDATHYYRA